MLHSKPKEKYFDKSPENRVNLKIMNPTDKPIQVNASLKNDTKGDVFSIDTNTIDVAPGETQYLTCLAFPKTINYFEDVIVITVKDNPEPYFYKISCLGVKPELEIDRRQIAFDKLLIGKVERRELVLKNPGLIPVSWKISGAETLGEEFTLTPLEGILESFQELSVLADFKPTKTSTTKRVIRVEITDIEKIGGVAQEYPILVTAESYDVAMDVHFPKGLDSVLDFGAIRVSDEGRQTLILRNRYWICTVLHIQYRIRFFSS